MTYVNDTPYPSVTQIIRPYINTEWFTEESAARGSAVHAACSAYVQGLFVPPLPAEWKGYFESFKKWSGNTDKVLLAEERLIDPALRFCGKPDLIITHKSTSGNILVDLKTGAADAKWYALQNAAYRHLATKKEKPIPTHRGITLRLKSDGTGCLATEYKADFRREFNVFLGLINAHYFFN
jgi:hypothetical protein